MAAFIFKEAVDRRIWLAVVFITAASVMLSFNFNEEWGVSLGALGILGACMLWGLDNNFTRNVSTKDPVKIVTIKGLCAGSFSLALAVLLHNPIPGLGVVVDAMLLGCASYGLSIVLFIHAMRCLGASRASALLGIAPFAGMLLSLALFREMPGALFFISLPVMVIGVILLLNERHSHEHVHAFLRHEHRHCHNDDHHTHHHDQSGLTPDCFHSHAHTHEAIRHLHPHTPDSHHRHVHLMNMT
jgi:drug/metabolite transporter (DMT)-like permease